MSDARANRPAPGPPPTIGYLRIQGVTRFHVACTAVNCQHSKDVTFDALGMPDDTPFPSIAARRRWICARCGCRKVNVMPRWPVQ